MSQMTLKTKAIVLRRTNYQEADRILQLLTPEGIFGVIAKSVRKEKSRLAGGIELLAVSDVTLHRKGEGLSILTSARLVEYFATIVGDYDRLQCAYDCLKIVASAGENTSEAEWYDVMYQVLWALDRGEIPLALIQAWFYIRVSAVLGYELSVYRDSEGNPLDAEKTYMYDAQEKSLRQHDKGEVTARHIKVLRLMSAHPLSTICHVGGVEDLLGECFYIAKRHASLS